MLGKGFGLRNSGFGRPLGYVLDVLLAVGLFSLDLPRVWKTYPGNEIEVWQPSTIAVVLVALQTLPIAARRLTPVPVLVVVLAAVIAYGALDGQPEPDYISVCVAVYTVAAEIPWEVSRWWCAVTLLLAPALLGRGPTSVAPSFLGVFRAVLLISLVAALGLGRRRSVLDRTRAAEERTRQDARAQALRVARQDLRRREQVARSLHDVLSRSMTLMVLRGEALKATTDNRETAAQIEAMLTCGRDVLDALPAALSTLDHAVLDDRPRSWAELLDQFRDSGLVIEADAGLTTIPLGDEVGSCLYRVVHEGLTNVLRHAGPTCSARITAAADANEVRVEVTNERGNEPAPYRLTSSGFGLASLELDVGTLGGSIEFGQLDDGWRLAARLPRHPVRERGAPGRPWAGGTIPVVLVDDQAMVREGLRLLLDAQPDIDVIGEFSDGQDLLAYLRKGVAGGEPPLPPPAEAAQQSARGRLVLLLDLVMPRVDGITVLRELREHPDREALAVLVLTTFGGETSVQRALGLGANGFVRKDGTAEQLATAVRAVANGLTTSLPRATGADHQGHGMVDGSAAEPLTPREAQVLGLLGEGLSNRAIAGRLGVSERTVKIHVSRVMSKLGVQSRTQAALVAQRDARGDTSTIW